MEIESLASIEAMWAAESERYKSGQLPDGFPVMPDIPAVRYYDPEFHRLEVEQVFRRGWIFVGHTSEWPEAGSYLTRDVAGVPVFVARAKDGIIRAFYNACTHRGAMLLHEERGCTPQINCPYHCWTFGLDGELRFVPDVADFPGLDLQSRNLKPIACEVYRGLVFIALKQPEEPLAVFLAGMDKALEDVPLEGATLFRRVVIPAECNWKCMQDAFSETYHVRYVHANSVNLALDPRHTARYMLAGGHNGMIVRARQAEGSGMVNVLDRKDQTQSAVAAPTTMRPITTVAQRSYNIFPNLTVPIAENLFPIQSIWPKGPDRCELELRMMKLPNGLGSPETDAATADAFCAIIGEDLQALAGMQASLASGAVPTLKLGHGEQFIANYQLELDARIGTDRVPPDMRVRPVSLPFA